MRMLVIAAHPDDEVLGCGGYIAKFSAKNEVFTVIVTEGCSSQYSEFDYKRIIEQKKQNAQEANKILGVKEIIFGNFPDMKLDTVKHIDLNRFLSDAITDINPDIILTHHSGDINLDHQLVYKSTMVAVRPTTKNLASILLYETPSATEWQSYDFKNIFIPNVFIDISDTIYKKIEALKSYEIELREFPHPRSEKGLISYAAFRGLACGLTAAEGFCLLRTVNLGVK